jgi:NPCBM/NEW2 domain
LLFLGGFASLSTAAELTTLDGKKSKGDILSIDGKHLILKTAGGNEEFEIAKLDSVSFAAAASIVPAKAIQVELVDGSQFRCSEFKIKNKMAVLTLLGSNLTVELPASLLLYMIRDLSDPKIEQAFRGIFLKRGRRDIWIIAKNGTLDGVNGTFGDGDPAGGSISFQFEAGDQKRDMQMSRIFGMIFNPPPTLTAATVCRVTDTDNNVIYAKSLTVTEKGGLLIETVTDVKITYPAMSLIAKIDFSAGSMLYLSNANPAKVEMSSTEGAPEPYRKDRNLDNGELKIAAKAYSKGLALHSRTMLTYDLGGKYKLFQAVAGIDDSVEGEDCKVTLTIEADSKSIFKQVIKKGDQPKTLSLAVLNVKELRIIVESDFLDLGNQVDLADAKLLK